MEESLKEKIIRFIVEEVQNECIGNGFQYIVGIDEIESKFNIVLTEQDRIDILDGVSYQEEVIDVELDDWGYDVVLGTAYSPNYDEDYYNDWY